MKPPFSEAESTGDESRKGRHRNWPGGTGAQKQPEGVFSSAKAIFKNVTQAVGLCWDAAQDLDRSPNVQMLSYPCMGKGEG